jgi:hypothetical protein
MTQSQKWAYNMIERDDRKSVSSQKRNMSKKAQSERALLMGFCPINCKDEIIALQSK